MRFKDGFSYWFGKMCGFTAGTVVFTVGCDITCHPKKYVDGVKNLIKKLVD